MGLFHFASLSLPNQTAYLDVLKKKKKRRGGFHLVNFMVNSVYLNHSFVKTLGKHSRRSTSEDVVIMR